MALPVIDVPLYELTIPSSGQTITVRPFSVKEEKLLLMASEGGKPEDVVSTVKQVINNCVIKGKVDIDRLPFFDIDYMFIFLRAKSIGDTQEIKLTCRNMPDGEHECGNVFPAQLDVGNVEIVKDPSISNDIKLDKTKGVKMKYPSYSTVKFLEAANTEVDKKTTLIANSIESIYDENGIYSSKDHSKEELIKFVEALTEENYRKLENFVDNTPVFLAKIDATCTKCGFQHSVRYSDFYDFFS